MSPTFLKDKVYFQPPTNRVKSIFHYSFMGISKELPVTGYVKMVDTWMIFAMSYPFLVIVVQCLKEDSNGFTV